MAFTFLLGGRVAKVLVKDRPQGVIGGDCAPCRFRDSNRKKRDRTARLRIQQQTRGNAWGGRFCHRSPEPWLLGLTFWSIDTHIEWSFEVASGVQNLLRCSG